MSLSTINIALLATDALGQPLEFDGFGFWLLFIFFLPVYAMLRNRSWLKMAFVAGFSLFFYFKASGWCVLLMLLTSLIDWNVSQLLNSPLYSRNVKRALLATSVFCSLGLLFFFKYGNFLVWNFDALLQRNFHPLDIVLPIGISFYTFRTISYVVDVYKGKIKPCDNYLDYLFFLSFFPVIVAGPIVRADRFLPQLRDNRPVTQDVIYSGLWLVITGVVKKAVIADYIGQYCNLIYGNPSGYSGAELLLGALGYAMQIYYDFSGYSDIAIGLGAILGFDLGMNFHFPYRALNITDFWRRWHISLSLWLRDYVYIPLGGNRKGRARQLANIMITMLLGGLWHGAAWRFVVWGGCHGMGLCMHKLCMGWLNRISNTRWVRGLSWLLTFTFVTTLWVFFRASSMNDALAVLGGIFTRFNAAYVPAVFHARWALCLMLVVAFVLHLVPNKLYGYLRQRFVHAHWLVKLVVLVAVGQLVLVFATADVQPFIYAQF